MIIKIIGLSAVAIGMFFIGYLIGWVEATHDDIFFELTYNYNDGRMGVWKRHITRC